MARPDPRLVEAARAAAGVARTERLAIRELGLAPAERRRWGGVCLVLGEQSTVQVTRQETTAPP